jgi:aspartyl-tRNA(Asn)/glutamyl-tRNA(Gln) amidotransferase subunit A
LNSAAQIARAVVSRATSAQEVARDAMARIRGANPRIGAFLAVDEALVLEEARSIDRRVAAGERLPLAGVPVAVKDNIAVAGYPLTCASRILEGFRPGYDATVIERLRTAGAVVAGKTNLDEFAMGSSTENSSAGATRNPWDLDRVPGGSSGGSAACVAARCVPIALGSDTGGSVRQPGALCGVVGFKPGYGRVSRHGLVAFASSLDQVGPLCRTVADAAAVYAVMAGPDPRDSTTSTQPVGDPSTALERGVAGRKIGVLREVLGQGMDSETEENFREAVDALRRAGAAVGEVSIPHAAYAIPIYYVVANAEASSNLARYDGIRYGAREPAAALEELYSRTRSRGFGAEVKRRILLGTFVLSAGYAEAYYRRASRARALLAREFDEAFTQVEAIVCPTVPGPAFRIGERFEDPLAMYLSDIFTTPASLAGLPAVSVPSGLTKGGLPLGLQILARRHDEATLFAVAAAYERETRHSDAVPPGFG